MKRITIVPLVLLIFAGVIANSQNNLPSEKKEKEQWDILYSFNSSESGVSGLATDGEYLYSSSWLGDKFYRYEMDGTLLESFSIPNFYGTIHDLTYDGQYFYGANTNREIIVLDLLNKQHIMTITLHDGVDVEGVRHISYDPALDSGNGGFWVGNYRELAAVDMQGEGLVFNSETPEFTNYVRGSAFDDVTDSENPKLWLFAEAPYPSQDVMFQEFDINTLELTGVSHNISDVPNFNSEKAEAGGAFAYQTDGIFILAGCSRHRPDLDLIFGYELAQTSNPLAPDSVTNFSVSPNATGMLEAGLVWNNPSSNIQGDELTELTSVEIEIDGEISHTIVSPTIGQQETYAATLSSAGFHNFEVAGYNSNGKGFVAKQKVFVGVDLQITEIIIPEYSEVGGIIKPKVKVVNNSGSKQSFIVELTNSDYSQTINVTDLDPQVEDLLVFPDRIFDQGGTTNFTATINYTGTDFAMSNNTSTASILVHNNIVVYDFEGGIPDNFALNSVGECGWLSGSNGDGDGEYFDIPEHPSVYAYVSDDVCNGDMSDVWMILPPLDFSEESNPFVKFESYTNHDFFTVKVGVDGVGWQDFLITPDNTGWKDEFIDLSSFANNSFVQIAFHYNDDGLWGYGWAIDNINVPGIPFGYYEAKFTVTDGTNPLQGAKVTIGQKTSITDENGIASIYLIDGSYSYTVEKRYYGTESGDISVNGEGITVSATLNELPTFDVKFIAMQENSPVQGVNINVYEEDITTNESGEALISLPNGTHNYLATKEGFNDIAGEVTVSGANTEETIYLFTGIKDENNSQVTIYPNPARGNFNIKVNESAELLIFNTQGKVVFSGFVKDECNVDLSNRENGIYTLQLKGKNKTHTRRVVILK